MDDLIKVYKRRCKEEFTSCGFKACNRLFYREIHDVFQGFELQKSVLGQECIVHFGVIPLCAGNAVKKTRTGANHLKMFENDDSWFGYNRNSSDIEMWNLEDIDRFIEENEKSK